MSYDWFCTQCRKRVSEEKARVSEEKARVRRVNIERIAEQYDGPEKTNDLILAALRAILSKVPKDERTIGDEGILLALVWRI